jgi:protocatechuate 3,4-dioxygenase beta subunit
VEADDRLVPIANDLVRALHRVVAEHQVTEAELHQALRFLAELGRADEWVLLSDVLGISVAVDGNTHRQEGQETPSNVQGPYYRPGAPLVSPPVVLCRDDEPGDVCFVAGRVLAAGDRRPLPGALLDVWQANQAGRYDQEDHPPQSLPEQKETVRCPGATLLEQVFANQREESGRWQPNQALSFDGALCCVGPSTTSTGPRGPPGARS